MAGQLPQQLAALSAPDFGQPVKGGGDQIMAGFWVKSYLQEKLLLFSSFPWSSHGMSWIFKIVQTSQQRSSSLLKHSLYGCSLEKILQEGLIRKHGIGLTPLRL